MILFSVWVWKGPGQKDDLLMYVEEGESEIAGSFQIQGKGESCSVVVEARWVPGSPPG